MGVDSQIALQEIFHHHVSDGPDADVHHRIGAKLRHDKWSVRLADRLSKGDFWPAETHRDPRRTVLNFLLLFAITTAMVFSATLGIAFDRTNRDRS